MSGNASVRNFMFAFNDGAFSDRELVIHILPENATRPESNDLRSPQNGVESDGSTSSEGCSKVLNLHVSSVVLAERSPFFHKLFANGMMESKQRCVTMNIHASEETAFVELLKYMYGGTLTITDAPALLDVLKLADRFEVISCMRLCVKLLRKLPMSTELALRYLEFTSSTSRTAEVQLLAYATKRFLEDRYNDIDKVKDEIMEMPLAVIEVILSSDVLKVLSEDTIFDLVVKWIEAHYPKLEDQKNILSSHLGKYIRFPYLSVDKLREALSCRILDDGFANKAVIDALFFKVKTAPHHHHSMKATKEDSSSSNYYHPYVRRAYKRRPIKVLPLPRQELSVHFDLNFFECINFKPEEGVYSDTFNFNGVEFYLYAGCHVDSLGAMEFVVRLLKDKACHVPFEVWYDFSSFSKRFNTFNQKDFGEDVKFHGKSAITLYRTPWNSFVARESLECVDGNLFLQVKLK